MDRVVSTLGMRHCTLCDTEHEMWLHQHHDRTFVVSPCHTLVHNTPATRHHSLAPSDEEPRDAKPPQVTARPEPTAARQRPEAILNIQDLGAAHSLLTLHESEGGSGRTKQQVPSIVLQGPTPVPGETNPARSTTTRNSIHWLIESVEGDPTVELPSFFPRTRPGHKKLRSFADVVKHIKANPIKSPFNPTFTQAPRAPRSKASLVRKGGLREKEGDWRKLAPLVPHRGPQGQ